MGLGASQPASVGSEAVKCTMQDCTHTKLHEHDTETSQDLALRLAKLNCAGLLRVTLSGHEVWSKICYGNNVPSYLQC